jgi:hypothetical protein
MKGNSSRALRAEEYRVNPDDRPGWVLASERTPMVGEQVYCASGDGTVLRVHGKTSDGSRLLQIKLELEKSAPFFAAASNVLVTPGA